MSSIEATKFYIRHRDGYPETNVLDYVRRGFDEQGVETAIYNSTQDIDNIQDLNQTTGVAGYIEDVLKALKKLNKTLPEPKDYPNELIPYLGREVRLGTLKDVITTTDNVFIKPVAHKAFTGFVWKDNVKSNRNIIGQKNETPIWISEYVDIISEYRCFILKGEILGVKHYNGDWSIAPDYSIVTDALSKTKDKDFPVAFCLDWGITKEGKTILIEMNDGFSFGHYGLHHCYVSQMLSARWFEMTK
jgi:hypothetical protein